jgi:hypothetical protein
MRADKQSPTIRELRRFKPAKFAITLRDETTRDVPLSTKANRWEQLLAILDKLPWKSIEAQAEDGAVLGIVEAEHDEEPDDDEDGFDFDPVAASVERISKQLVHVMVVTQQETRKGFEATLRGHTEMTHAMLEAVNMIREASSTAMKIRDLAQMAEGSGDPTGSTENIMKMLAMGMQMMQAQKSGPPPVTINVPPAQYAAPRPKSSPPNPMSPKQTNGVDVGK